MEVCGSAQVHQRSQNSDAVVVDYVLYLYYTVHCTTDFVQQYYSVQYGAGAHKLLGFILRVRELEIRVWRVSYLVYDSYDRHHSGLSARRALLLFLPVITPIINSCTSKVYCIFLICSYTNGPTINTTLQHCTIVLLIQQ